MKPKYALLVGWLFAMNTLFADVTVVFENPEDFRDVDYGYKGTKRGMKIYLPQLEEHFEKQGKRFLEEGMAMSVTVTDVDLAGEHEPWLPPPADDIRIVKSIYPPRITFSYELRDAEGNVVLSGDERLVDLGFDFRVRINFHDDLFYDKAMITDWFRKLRRDLET